MSSSRLCSLKCWSVWPQCARLTKGNQIKCEGLQCAVKSPQGVFSYVLSFVFPVLVLRGVFCLCFFIFLGVCYISYFLLQGVLCLCFSFFVFFISCFPLLDCKVSCVCVLYFKVLSFVFLFRIPRACIAVCLAKPKCLLVSAGGSQAIASLTFPCQQLLTPQQSANFHFDIYHLPVFFPVSFLSFRSVVGCQLARNNSFIFFPSSRWGTFFFEMDVICFILIKI